MRVQRRAIYGAATRESIKGKVHEPISVHNVRTVNSEGTTSLLAAHSSCGDLGRQMENGRHQKGPTTGYFYSQIGASLCMALPNSLTRAAEQLIFWVG